MADESNKLAKRTGSLFAGKKVGLAAKIEEARQSFNPEEMTHRIGLIFDDSGSMSGEPLKRAKEAVDAFLKSCNPHETSMALYLLGRDENNRSLTTDLILLNMYVQGLGCPNGTPLFTAMDKLINKEKITRAIIFSDGGPTDGSVVKNDWTTGKETVDPDVNVKTIVEQYKAKGIMADTVFIGSPSDTTAITTLKWIAEQTGGVFLQFEDATTFAKNFKYLAPKFRAMLSDKSFVAEITKK